MEKGDKEYIMVTLGNGTVQKFDKQVSDERVEEYVHMNEDNLRCEYKRCLRSLKKSIGTSDFAMRRLFYDEVCNACKIKGIDYSKWYF